MCGREEHDLAMSCIYSALSSLYLVSRVLGHAPYCGGNTGTTIPKRFLFFPLCITILCLFTCWPVYFCLDLAVDIQISSAIQQKYYSNCNLSLYVRSRMFVISDPLSPTKSHNFLLQNCIRGRQRFTGQMCTIMLQDDEFSTNH